MRYVLYLLTLGLVFTTGMLVGNFYLPVHNDSMAAAISAPDISHANPAMDTATLEQAQYNLHLLAEALASCPAVVEIEKERLFNQLSLFLALQDFKVKKYAYETEIAKNGTENRTTTQYSRAAADYSAAKTNTELLADKLFPLVVSSPISPSEPRDTVLDTTFAQQLITEDKK